jgi:hypothetical protein
VEPAELERARVVDEDLRYFMEEWRPRLDRAELRCTSPILRRLLVDGDFGRAWRSVGLPDEPSVSAPTLDAMLGTVNREYVQLAIVPPGQTVRDTRNSAAGGVKIHLRAQRAVAAGRIAVVMPGYTDGPEQFVEREIHGKLGRRMVRGQMLSAYLSSPAALADTVAISRRDVIQYVANKEGGAHLPGFAPHPAHLPGLRDGARTRHAHVGAVPLPQHGLARHPDRRGRPRYAGRRASQRRLTATPRTRSRTRHAAFAAPLRRGPIRA